MLASSYGGVAVKSREDIQRISRRRRNDFPESFCSALDNMQEAGFTTELWLNKNTTSVMFRWTNNGSKWHVTARGIKNLRTCLDEMGENALRWCKARQSGTGREQNYAVRET